MSCRTYRLGAVIVLAGVLLTGCSGTKQDTPTPAAVTPFEPVPVAITVTPKLEEPVSIGLIVPPVEGYGEEFRPLAEGAGVAARRFQAGSTDVRIVTALDDGTPAGALSAMNTLLNQHVAGVVFTAAGAHSVEALQAASAAQTAVIITHTAPPPETFDAVWSLAPSSAAVTEALAGAASEAGASKPLLAVGANPTVEVSPVKTFSVDDLASLTAAITEGIDAREIDSIYIVASARQQATAVAAIQTTLGGRQIPILLTPQTQTPLFATLAAESSTTPGWWITAGTDTQDHVALTRSDAGDRVAAFLAALRLGAQDPECRNVYDDDTCAATGAHADIVSHDAVAALVFAAAAAGTATPEAVQAALESLKLDSGDGIAGASLDFTKPYALGEGSVVALRASAADSGLRPRPPDGRPSQLLDWFQEQNS
jgi:ABC-type branched-subunit amino acid transport system substrate-binding protein